MNKSWELIQDQHFTLCAPSTVRKGQGEVLKALGCGGTNTETIKLQYNKSTDEKEEILYLQKSYRGEGRDKVCRDRE